MASPLAQIYAPIRNELDQADALIDSALARCDTQMADLVAHAARYGGKRLRPALLLLAARACGGTTDRHVRAAAIVELIHTATLVHDDVIDEADRRRRGETINARWGTDISIMLGDLLFARALEMFAQCASPTEHALLTAALREVCEGEILQLFACRQSTLDEPRYIDIVAKKTGALCSAACALGAAMAGHDHDVLKRFAAFGRAVGIALQIADDCLDITGDEHAMGKTLGLDLASGKLTLPIIHARAHGPDPARAQLEELLANPNAQGIRTRLADILTRCGSFAYSQRTAHRHVEQAASQLTQLGTQPEHDALFALAEFVVERDI